jgi:hypothetical protein
VQLLKARDDLISGRHCEANRIADRGSNLLHSLFIVRVGDCDERSLCSVDGAKAERDRLVFPGEVRPHDLGEGRVEVRLELGERHPRLRCERLGKLVLCRGAHLHQQASDPRASGTLERKRASDRVVVHRVFLDQDFAQLLAWRHVDPVSRVRSSFQVDPRMGSAAASRQLFSITDAQVSLAHRHHERRTAAARSTTRHPHTSPIA